MHKFFGPYVELLYRIWNNQFPLQKPARLALIEKLIFTLLIGARFPSPSNLKHWFPSGPSRKAFMDCYVFFWVLLCLVGLLLGLSLPYWCVWLFAFEVWDICSYRLFFFLVKSHERPWGANLRMTLLIAAANFAEITLAFAIIHLHVGDVSRDCASGKPLSSPVDALYFSLVTITTVGFGDFLPCTETGRILVVAEIVASLIFLILVSPLLLSVFATELRRQ